MNTPDPQLRELLKHWSGPEPRPGFAQDVRRRLRLADTAPAAVAWWLFLSAWLGAPRRLAMACGGALLLAFAAGWSTQLIRPAPAAVPSPLTVGFSVLPPGSVAGNYVAMIGDR